jgi:molybdate/tungstate transport system substrate-binding protein
MSAAVGIHFNRTGGSGAEFRVVELPLLHHADAADYCVVRRSCTYVILLVLAAAACGDRSVSRSPNRHVLLYIAASLTKPLGPMLDTFARRNDIVVERESGASLEHARKLTDLGRVPDVILLADPEVFPQLLMPKHVAWYADLARNRMTIGYTERSRYAAQLDSTNWPTILARPDVQVGRPDPDLAPAGYRTLLLLQLAEKYYHEPGLASRVLANAPPKNMRPNAAELAALLETGELDYIFDYASVAAAYGFHALRLPPEIDLSDPRRAADYARASVRVNGHAGDSVTFVGAPILYALSIPRNAPDPEAALRLAAFMLSPDGRRMMHEAHVDALDHALFVGDSVPPAIRDAAAR